MFREMRRKKQLLTLEESAAVLHRGTSGVLALAGDAGCSGGPTLAGMVSGMAGDNLRLGILAAIIFPFLLLAGLLICRNLKAKSR